MSGFCNEQPKPFRGQHGAFVTSLAVSVYCLSFAGAADAQNRETRTLEEVIVTAQKRSERLQDVPVPVTALSADSLTTNNQVRLQDYYRRVPGLVYATTSLGEPQISIRGITTGSNVVPTVGVTVDDVPYGSSVVSGVGYLTPDLDPSDLAQVEVLRGPQGTLYGANSIGGLLKYVTADPSTERMSGRVELGANSVHNSNDSGYSFRGALNMPLGETFAARISGFKRRDAGYIDNPSIGAESVNQTDVEGGRVSALWQPSERFSVKLSGLIQKVEGDGSPQVSIVPGLGDLQQIGPRNTGQHNRKYQNYSVIVKAGLGPAELTSVSGYSINRFDDSVSTTAVAAVPSPKTIFDFAETEKWSEELRLAGPIGDSFDWLVGGFYTREYVKGTQDVTSLEAATGDPLQSLVFIDTKSRYKEYAAFGNLTYHFNDRFDVQFGGRHGENDQTYYRIATGPFTSSIYGIPAPAILPERGVKDDFNTYLVTPRFKVNPDFMVYARFASGYRPGSLNSGLPIVPISYKADTTLNYELGTKGSIFENAVKFDLSVYHIDWTDIQIRVLPPAGTAIPYIANVAEARSQGAEASFEFRPFTGTTIGVWGAYNKAELSEDFPATATVRGGEGERLPFSAEWSGSLSVDQDFSITSTLMATVGASFSYVDDRFGDFVGATSRRQEFPSYTQLDLHVGLEFDTWQANVYANNLTDERGALTGNPSIVPSGVVYIQPRTIGMSISRTF